MDDPAQAAAYAAADFSEPHSSFIEHFGRVYPYASVKGRVVDLGCGPGDITFRFAHAFPDCEIHGVDGAQKMLALANTRLKRERLANRVRFQAAYLPDTSALQRGYGIAISNSLLHHLAEAQTLWTALRALLTPGGYIFIMDLLRPPSEDAAVALVEQYAASEPEVLKRDFLNSLRAAYREDEVKGQLRNAGLDGICVECVSDRHWIAYGTAT
jgi:trans-aconitate methyltransferase